MDSHDLSGAALRHARATVGAKRPFEICDLQDPRHTAPRHDVDRATAPPPYIGVALARRVSAHSRATRFVLDRCKLDFEPRRGGSSRPVRVVYCRVDASLFITDELRSACYMLVPEKE